MHRRGEHAKKEEPQCNRRRQGVVSKVEHRPARQPHRSKHPQSQWQQETYIANPAQHVGARQAQAVEEEQKEDRTVGHEPRDRFAFARYRDNARQQNR